MKWFKHKTASHEDPDISDAWDEFGDAGYTIFFVTLEIYGREFGSTNDVGELTLTRRYFQRKLRRKWKTIENVLGFYRERARINWKCSENAITLQIPEFIKLASTWARRCKRLSPEVPTESPPEAPQPIEGEGETDPKPFVYECDRFKIDPKTHKKYEDAFPDVDLMKHYKKMAAWLASRPNSDYGQIMVFVYEWLKNEQGSKTAFQEVGKALRGAGVKGMPPEAHKPERKHAARPETDRERTERLRKRIRDEREAG